MTFTYTPGEPSAKERIRFRIGDTDETAPTNARLEDEEILDALIVACGTVEPSARGFLFAAADCADALAAKFARLPEGSSGGPVPNRTRAQELRALASRLRLEAQSSVIPFAGGLSAAGKAAVQANPDRPADAFRVGMLDNPEGR